MDSNVKFESLTVEEIAKFVQDNHSEFGEEFDAGKAEQIVALVRGHGTVIEQRPFGFAVIHPVGSTKTGGFGFATERKAPVLWYIYIEKSARGTGVGSKLLAEIVQKFAATAAITLLCHGTQRRNYFAARGFVTAHGIEEDPFVMDHPAQGAA